MVRLLFKKEKKNKVEREQAVCRQRYQCLEIVSTLWSRDKLYYTSDVGKWKDDESMGPSLNINTELQFSLCLLKLSHYSPIRYLLRLRLKVATASFIHQNWSWQQWPGLIIITFDKSPSASSELNPEKQLSIYSPLRHRTPMC